MTQTSSRSAICGKQRTSLPWGTMLIRLRLNAKKKRWGPPANCPKNRTQKMVQLRPWSRRKMNKNNCLANLRLLQNAILNLRLQPATSTLASRLTTRRMIKINPTQQRNWWLSSHIVTLALRWARSECAKLPFHSSRKLSLWLLAVKFVAIDLLKSNKEVEFRNARLKSLLAWWSPQTSTETFSKVTQPS